ncbi:hypothetical protein ABE205_19325 [Brevibacillus agri]|uniref:hypothetical protein n=1 Tax=Brevibacillus agri TaxID=51101 RepID=UPI003D1E52F5
MSKVRFPELDEAIEKFVSAQAAKNIEIVCLADEETALSDDLYVRSVLLTDERELVHFYQICLVSGSRYNYTAVETNRISTRYIRMYTEYLDKKERPIVNEGESGR